MYPKDSCTKNFTSVTTLVRSVLQRTLIGNQEAISPITAMFMEMEVIVSRARNLVLSFTKFFTDGETLLDMAAKDGCNDAAKLLFPQGAFIWPIRLKLQTCFPLCYIHVPKNSDHNITSAVSLISYYLSNL